MPFSDPKYVWAFTHQRDESTKKHRQRNHGREIATKKRNTCITKERALVLLVSF